jgi:putative ABC transport system substrate-binding protein
LRELGYIEGENIVIEYRYAEHERQRAHAAELVRLPVDVIFATSTTVARVAKYVSRTTPVVFLSAAEPVSAGLVQNLARPGGNLTGFATIAAVLAGKRLELLQETIPKLSRVAVLWEPKNQGSEESWEEGQQAARQLGLQIHFLPVSSAHKFESAFGEASNTRTGALAVTLSVCLVLIKSSSCRWQ